MACIILAVIITVSMWEGSFFPVSMQSMKASISFWEHVLHLELRLILHQCAVFCCVDCEVLTILQADAGLVAHEIDKHFILSDILRPRPVHSDHGPIGADHASDGILHIVGAVVLRRPCPHVFVGVSFEVLTELAENLACNCPGLRIAAAVHHNIQEMHAPVYQGTASSHSLGSEVATQPRNGAV